MAVQFTSDIVIQSKKEDILANKENKQCFLYMLSDRLKKIECEVHNARSDAELVIVQTQQ